jgi:hypothetical protein
MTTTSHHLTYTIIAYQPGLVKEILTPFSTFSVDGDSKVEFLCKYI